MKLLLWNVNGIRACYKQDLRTIFDQNLADIVCLEEVKAWPEQLSSEQLCPNNYQSEFSIAEKKGYSGVATFSSKALPQTQIQKGFGEARFDSEGRILVSKFQDFLVYNIYFPSGTTGELRQNFKYEFLDYVYNYFATLSTSERANAIVCGDFNICHREIDIHHPKKAEQQQLSGFLKPERDWVSRFLELGFSDAFRQANGDLSSQYTWWSYRAGSRGKNLGWRIDYFMLGKTIQARLESCQILTDLKGSDHAPVLVTLA